eukprot:INCI13584.1.p1 GENE.INCI13584.1~~INCI13584.1.p1  ORF type:complete len:817 (-),score=177.06 INCI13584.1:28-2478(-)
MGGGSSRAHVTERSASLGPDTKTAKGGSGGGGSGSGRGLSRSSTDQDLHLENLETFTHQGDFVDDGSRVPPLLGSQLLASLPSQHRAIWNKFFTQALQDGGHREDLSAAAEAACNALRTSPAHGRGVFDDTAAKPGKHAAVRKAAANVAEAVDAAARVLRWCLDAPLAHGLAAAEAEAAADEQSMWTDMTMTDYAEMLVKHLGAAAQPSNQAQSVRTRALLVRALQAISDACARTFPASTGVLQYALPDDCFLSLAICQLLRCLSPFLLDKGRAPAVLLQEFGEVDALLFGPSGQPDHSSPLQEHLAVVDHAGKALLLNLYIGNRTPLDIVLSRETVFDDLVVALRDDSGNNDRPLEQPSVVTLRAYFKSEYGKKRVNGHQVEEGEGLGPRKEFYSLASLDLSSAWRGQRRLEGSIAAAKGASTVTGRDTRFLRDVQKGMRISVGLGDDNKPQNEAGVVVEVVSDTELRVERRFQSAHVEESAWVSSPAQPLFVYSKTQEAFWFNSSLQQTADLELRFVAAGRMVAAALADRCKLDTVLSEHIFAQLLTTTTKSAPLEAVYCPTSHDLEHFDAGAAKHVVSAFGASPAHLRDLIEEADWEGEVITTAEQYVTRSCRELMLDQVGWQAAALHRGFQLGVRSEWWQQCPLSPRQLQMVVCGATDTTSDFDFRKVFRVVEDPELQQCHPLREALWHTIDSLDRVQKRKLLRFITGVDRLPSAGTEMIKIEMPFMAYSQEEHEKTLLMMPQAHTCDNILELPNYWQSLKAVRRGQAGADDSSDDAAANADLVKELRDIIRQKVETAFSLSEGFGLDSAFH